MSDWVIAAIGFCIRGFHEAVAAQRDNVWAREPFTSTTGRLTEFASLRAGIVGLGGIGQAVARKCHALGMEVRAVRRQAAMPAPPEVTWVGGPESLADMAAQSDVLILALPHTGATDNLVDEEILQALPRGAYLLNVSRGGILDEEALLRHLQDGHIRGCVLDVFATEPLDAAHPFWKEPNVLVTPHVSAVTDRFWEREIELLVENIGRYLQGNRLRNVVNLEAGY
jgi:phosphoglycerate dehydrogenase-like enzyme